jgi:hypothetical protein
MTIFTESSPRKRTFEEAMDTRARLLGTFGADVVVGIMDRKCSPQTGVTYANELLNYATEVHAAATAVAVAQRENRPFTAEEIEVLEAVVPAWQLDRWL